MKYLLLIMVTILIFSCEKDEDVFGNLGGISDLNDALGVQCLGDIREESVYRNLVFVDDFVPVAGDPCYTDQSKLHCANVMEWFEQTKSCPEDYNYSNVKDLNKCVWTVWTGWNFWNDKSQSTYRPEAMQIKNGHLILNTIKNPGYNPNDPLGCDDPHPQYPHQKYRNCPLAIGGVDSKYKTEAKTGRSVRYGKIEIRAKYQSNDNSYPALWTWHNSIGKGYPHVAEESYRMVNGVKQSFIGEIDILEHNSRTQGDYAFHTYHNWKPSEYGGGSSFSPKGSIYSLSNYRIYGVEWTPDRIRFFVDNCIVHEIKNGEKGPAGDNSHLAITNTSSFIILGLAYAHGVNPQTYNNKSDTFMIDWVKVYE